MMFFWLMKQRIKYEKPLWGTVNFGGDWGLFGGVMEASGMRALAPLDVGEGLQSIKGDLIANFGPPQLDFTPM